VPLSGIGGGVAGICRSDGYRIARHRCSWRGDNNLCPGSRRVTLGLGVGTRHHACLELSYGQTGLARGSIKPIASVDLTFTAPMTAGPHTVTLYGNNTTTIILGQASYAVSGASKPSGGVSSVTCAGATKCSSSSGDVTITGTQAVGPQGAAGPAGPAGAQGAAGAAGAQGPTGPPGEMALGTPQKGVACDNKHGNGQPGDSRFDYDNRAAPTQRFTWTCNGDGKWYQDATVKVIPW
jgi:hypothetical protein